jgi:hypothetical protein
MASRALCCSFAAPSCISLSDKLTFNTANIQHGHFQRSRDPRANSCIPGTGLQFLLKFTRVSPLRSPVSLFALSAVQITTYCRPARRPQAGRYFGRYSDGYGMDHLGSVPGRRKILLFNGIQIGCEVHPTSSSVGTRSHFSGGLSRWGVKLIGNLHRVPRSPPQYLTD